MYNFVYLSCELFELWLLKAEKGPFFKIWGKTGLFRPLNDHNSKNSQDKHTKLYIFEISVKFCVDWYVGWYILKILKKYIQLAVYEFLMRISYNFLDSKNPEKIHEAFYHGR